MNNNIKIGELLFMQRDKVFGVVYHKDDEGFYLIDWTDGFTLEERYTESDIVNWRMWRTTYDAEYQGG